MTISRRIVAEFLGTAFLLTAVVGSGIMGQNLAGGNTAIALLSALLLRLFFFVGLCPRFLLKRMMWCFPMRTPAANDL